MQAHGRGKEGGHPRHPHSAEDAQELGDPAARSHEQVPAVRGWGAAASVGLALSCLARMKRLSGFVCVWLWVRVCVCVVKKEGEKKRKKGCVCTLERVTPHSLNLPCKGCSFGSWSQGISESSCTLQNGCSIPLPLKKTFGRSSAACLY